MTDAIDLKVQLPTSPDDTWELLTYPTHLGAWFGPHIRLDAKPGGEFRETWSQGGRELVTHGRITEFRRPTAIAWTWADEDWPHSTLLTLTIRAHDGSLVELRHSGWDAFGAPDGDELRAAHEAGWRGHLESLKRYATERAVAE